MIKQLFYSMLAPLLRWLLRGCIVGKKLEGSQLRLYYDRGQHLGFLGKKCIRYEPEYRDQILSQVTEGDTVIEIGSNIGQYTLYLAEKVGPGGKVIAIEPDHENFSFLQFNMSMNEMDHVTLRHFAVSDREGHAEFHRDTITGGRTSTLLNQFVGREYKGVKARVRTTTLKQLLKEFGVPSVIKIDVEGAEDLVVSPEGSLHPDITYIIEVQKETKPKIIQRFQQSGFTVFDLMTTNRVIQYPDEVPDFRVLMFKYVNPKGPKSFNE